VCILSLSFKSVRFRANENRLNWTREGAVASAVRVWFFGAALVEIFISFFFCLFAQRKLASFCLERNVLRDEDECVLFDEMRRYERADATVFVSLWTYSLRILWSFPGVVVFCAHRRRDDGRAILVLREKTFLGLCVVQMSSATKNVTKSRILTSSFLFFSKKQQNTNLQTWVACTAKEKGCPNRPSLSNDRRRSGAKPPRMKSKTWSRRWRRKAWRRRKSASSWEITTASRKCPRWPTPKSCASWRVKVWRRLCRKICTVWSRKPCPCASTWRETARTWTPSFDWFWSNPESTDWRDTTDSRRSWSRTGGTSLRQPPRSWRSKCVSLHAYIY